MNITDEMKRKIALVRKLQEPPKPSNPAQPTIPTSKDSILPGKQTKK